MKRDNIYLAVIGVLVVVVLAQWLFAPKKKPVRKVAPARKAAVVPAPARPTAAVKGKIAIVIDDWGNHENTLPIARRIDAPLTAAVLPSLRYSRSVSTALHDYGFEIILHLPMEPNGKFKLEKNTITTEMSAPKVQEIVRNDLNTLAYAQGVSNHMGSKATSDVRTMRAVLTELKGQGLYFLDSFVIQKSVVREVAREMGVPTAARDVFLDNKNDAAYIRNQISQLKAKAARYGSAIGIGHDRALTLETLVQAIPQLKKEGFVFVHVSELVN